jgi:transposase
VLFLIEQAAADLSVEDCVPLRQEKAVPVLEEIRAWLELSLTKVLPKSPTGQAIG